MMPKPLLKTTALLVLPSAALVAATTLWWPGVVRTYYPDLPAGSLLATLPWKISVTLLGISVILLFVNAMGLALSRPSPKHPDRPPMPALLRDLIRYGSLVVLVTIVLRILWGDEVSPLIGALGVGGVVLGFALQETLSNFFAGLALLAERPFSQGDWVRVGERPEGVVEHITWRAMKIRTRDNDYLIFPNSMVAKEVIQNFREPSPTQAVRLRLGTSYDDPPAKVKRVLHGVLDSVPAVQRSPAPAVRLVAYSDFSIDYEIKCYIGDYARRPDILDDIMSRVWYAFRREDIEIPFPIRTVHMRQVTPGAGPAKNEVDVDAVLGRVAVMQALSPEERRLLASHARVREYGPKEPLLRQGDPGETMYAIVSGSARVTIRSEDGTERTVAMLKSGDVVGEMSLLTGDPRTANVYAAEGDLVLVEISKDDLAPILRENPSVAERIAEIVSSRQRELERVKAEAAGAATPVAAEDGARKGLLGRIRKFFGL